MLLIFFDTALQAPQNADWVRDGIPEDFALSAFSLTKRGGIFRCSKDGMIDTSLNIYFNLNILTA